jgi:hypothetical protein
VVGGVLLASTAQQRELTDCPLWLAQTLSRTTITRNDRCKHSEDRRYYCSTVVEERNMGCSYVSPFAAAGGCFNSWWPPNSNIFVFSYIFYRRQCLTSGPTTKLIYPGEVRTAPRANTTRRDEVTLYSIPYAPGPHSYTGPPIHQSSQVTTALQLQVHKLFRKKHKQMGTWGVNLIKTFYTVY